MSTFLIGSATSQSNSYPIVLTRLGGSRFRPNPHLKFVEVPRIKPATLWSEVRHADQRRYTVQYNIYLIIGIWISALLHEECNISDYNKSKILQVMLIYGHGAGLVTMIIMWRVQNSPNTYCRVQNCMVWCFLSVVKLLPWEHYWRNINAYHILCGDCFRLYV